MTTTYITVTTGGARHHAADASTAFFFHGVGPYYSTVCGRTDATPVPPQGEFVPEAETSCAKCAKAVK